MKFLLQTIVLTGLVTSPPCAFAMDLLPLRVIEASEGQDAISGVPLLNVRLDKESGDRLAKWTSSHVRTRIDIIIDGRVISRPRLLTPLTGAVMQLPGLTGHEIAVLLPRLLDDRSSLAVEGHE